MEQKNLDIYGHAPLSWDDALAKLQTRAGHLTYWLGTTSADGQPHVAGVGALWIDGRLYFVSGPATRKSRNLAQNARCSIGVVLPGLDLVLEGRAERVRDAATVAHVVAEY